MKHHPLGRTNLKISALGLGCMGMSHAYGSPDDAESLRVLHRYVELGGNFLDTAEIYGPFTNEELVGRFLRETNRDHLVIATKFGFSIDSQTGTVNGMNSRPENIRKVCDESLLRLGIDTIDLFYQHRVDPACPIEETVGALGGLIAAGKIRAIGLSEASAETIRRANAVHLIAALQSEYSLWTRDPEKNGTLDVCRELGITFVPYSPLGRGFLTGTIQSPADLEEKDWRRTNPRFQEDAMKENLELAEEIKVLAKKKNCTPAQFALAWVIAQGSDIVPIPGTKRLKYLEENMHAAAITFTAEELAEIHSLFPHGAATGARYSEAMMAALNQ
ncbi:MAG: aldo/keto reductase [Chthoniobacterales bacterium]